jgi:RND family efflux transporter MFP subunit
MIVVIVVICALAGGAVWVFARQQNDDDADQTVLLHTVERSDFTAFVTEPGDVASSSNVEIRCRVRARGAAGTPILKIAEEGTSVIKDDPLIEFDDSVLQQDLLQQKILVANDKALLIQAQSNLANAKRTLTEYTEGLFAQERDVINTELFVAEETLQRAVAYAQYSRRLNVRGYHTGAQLRADEFAVEKAQKDLATAKRKLDVYDRFTKEKMVGEYKAEIEKQEANVEAATFTLALSQQKLAEIDQQISACKVLAPAAGQVVHANDRDRREQPIVMEEGTLIRENQVVIRLPDLNNMQVDCKINESHVNRIKTGQPAEIILDADPAQVLRGKVGEVAPYPIPQRWHGSPMEYGTKVTIIDPPPTIRPGQRAKVRIIFDTQPDVLQVPLAAVIEKDERHFCLVRDEEGWKPRAVDIGASNNNQVVVTQGLSEGDQVSLTPFRHIERSDLETPTELAADKDATQNSAKPDVSRSAGKADPAS